MRDNAVRTARGERPSGAISPIRETAPISFPRERIVSPHTVTKSERALAARAIVV
jgi:hypothetical protein